MILTVDARALTLTADGVRIPCRLGRGGVVDTDAKREGDGATPRAVLPLRQALFRPDRGLGLPATPLPWRFVSRDDGWSDDPADPDYNRPVRLPHAFSAERLWRDDGLYDIVVPLGWNDDPPVPGRGSAIFLHCTDPGHPATAGCVAVAREALRALLPWLTVDSVVEIA